MFPAKTAERIDVLFAVETPGGPRNIALSGGPSTEEEGEWGILPIVLHIFTVDPTNLHWLGGGTFDAAIATLL